MEGLIIKNISNDYIVKVNNNTYTCKARGKFRKDKITPLVGDKVLFNEFEKYITEIKPRKNSLIRPNISNVDQSIIVTSVKTPDLDLNLLDKLLTIISYNNIEPIICITKYDLLTEEERPLIDNILNYYKNIGYKVIKNTDIDTIKQVLKNKISVLTGQSGAGKSSLLNRLDNKLNLKTEEISTALNRGKHTTRHTQLYALYNGFIADTPGFSQIDFIDIKKSDIRDNMKEMFENLHYCKYRDCMHLKEEGCKVKELLEKKQILVTRYENYCKFLDSIK